MITLMTGAIFEDGFVTSIDKLNQKYEKVKVEEVYSSLRASNSGLPTARPDFRLKSISWKYLENYIKKCHKFGIEYNYTMNANYLGDLERISKNYNTFISAIRILESIGVDRVTIANPILMDIVSRNSSLNIEASTIMNIDSVQTPRVIKNLYPNIDKICLALTRNRSIAFVQQMKTACDEVGITLEVMSNEFCMVDNAPCQNIHRNTCYQLHSENMSQDVAQKGRNSDGSKQQKEISGYPWYIKTGCIFGRNVDKVAWLNARTIWPNEFFEYSKITGIDKFKVTCRTAPKDFALTLIERYMSGSYNGLLAGLWLQLQASSLSARKNFDKIQSGAAEKVPFHTELLSKPHQVEMKRSDGLVVEGPYKFFDRFFLDPNYDPDMYVSVDKPTDKLLPYEDNWVYRWAKISDINNLNSDYI